MIQKRRYDSSPPSSLFVNDRLPAPIDKIGHCRLAAPALDELGDLPAVVPGMPEKLRQDLFDGVAKFAGVKALVVEDARQFFIVQPGKISVPHPMDLFGEAGQIDRKR